MRLRLGLDLEETFEMIYQLSNVIKEVNPFKKIHYLAIRL